VEKALNLGRCVCCGQLKPIYKKKVFVLPHGMADGYPKSFCKACFDEHKNEPEEYFDSLPSDPIVEKQKRFLPFRLLCFSYDELKQQEILSESNETYFLRCEGCGSIRTVNKVVPTDLHHSEIEAK
jgi:hypothetical protein